MTEYSKGIITISVASIVLIALVCLGLNTYEKKINSQQYTKETVNMAEWVSPDGVHYWLGTHGYKGYFAPRYDNNGNLVIDK